MGNEIVTKNTKMEIAAAIGNSSIADSILRNFNQLATQGQLVFPKGYNLGNQLKLAYTYLIQNVDVSGVTPVSIGETLTEFAIQGLEIDKKQAYFIKYGNKLQMFRSYYGDVAVCKNTGLVKDVKARVIYKGDEYDLDTNEDGESIVTGHRTKLENMDNPIVGAYAWADLPNHKRTYCIMTWKEIQTNWAKSKNPNGNVQKDFPQEMAKRTVIRRLVKMIFNTAPSTISEEAQSIIGSYNRTTDAEYDNEQVDYGKPTRKSTVGNVIVDDETGLVEDELPTTPEETNTTAEDTPAEETK